LTDLDSLRKADVLENGPPPLRIANPLSPDQAFLRTSLRPSMLKTMAANRHHLEPLRLFEVGRIYLPREGDLPEEREVAIAAFAGSRFPISWATSQEGADFYDAKGIAETLLHELDVPGTFQPARERGLHPGKTARIVAGDTTLGVAGEVHPSVIESFDLEESSVALVELDLERLFRALPSQGRTYSPLPRFPSAVRDLSLLVDQDVPATKVQEVILNNPLLTRVTLFDVYEGEGIPHGQRSLAYRLHFQSPKRTLTAGEVAHALEKIVESLRRQVGARPRQRDDSNPTPQGKDSQG